jgi:hypothetical protein
MEILQNLILLREYCRQNSWPRLAQWNHWIYSPNPIAMKCVKRLAGVTCWIYMLLKHTWINQYYNNKDKGVLII